jgi:hypothetical protein
MSRLRNTGSNDGPRSIRPVASHEWHTGPPTHCRQRARSHTCCHVKSSLQTMQAVGLGHRERYARISARPCGGFPSTGPARSSIPATACLAVSTRHCLREPKHRVPAAEAASRNCNEPRTLCSCGESRQDTNSQSYRDKDSVIVRTQLELINTHS